MSRSNAIANVMRGIASNLLAERRNWMKKGMKDVGGARKAERQRVDEAKRCHCLRSVAHPARQDLFGSLRAEGRPGAKGVGSAY